MIDLMHIYAPLPINLNKIDWIRICQQTSIEERIDERSDLISLHYPTINGDEWTNNSTFEFLIDTNDKWNSDTQN